MNPKLCRGLAVAAVLAAAPIGGVAQAHANFIGSQVTATLYNPQILPGDILGGPSTATVGPSVEFPSGTINGNTNFSIDLTSDQINYTPLANVTYGNGPFNGFVFKFSGAPPITGVSLGGSSTFTPTAITFTSNSINLNLSGNTVTYGGLAQLNVTFAPVPEPAMWAMMVLGVAGLGAQLRRRRALTA
jgi:hypothetical protein